MKCHVGVLLWVTNLSVCNELMFCIKVMSLLLACVKCIVSDPLYLFHWLGVLWNSSLFFIKKRELFNILLVNIYALTSDDNFILTTVLSRLSVLIVLHTSPSRPLLVLLNKSVLKTFSYLSSKTFPYLSVKTYTSPAQPLCNCLSKSFHACLSRPLHSSPSRPFHTCSPSTSYRLSYLTITASSQ